MNTPTRRPGIAVPWVMLFVLGGALAASAQEAVPPAQKIDKVFERWAGGATPGCAVGVSVQGKPAYTQGYGLANLE